MASKCTSSNRDASGAPTKQLQNGWTMIASDDESQLELSNEEPQPELSDEEPQLELSDKDSQLELSGVEAPTAKSIVLVKKREGKSIESTTDNKKAKGDEPSRIISQGHTEVNLKDAGPLIPQVYHPCCAICSKEYSHFPDL